ncbi:hypothetical protein OL239_11050 [Arthrobacter sp. ATA002]|uniref:hypothetical protein n=1 Tax=Arthrobacter sp. ATA002 TaxID=2991715 RepID=UPI0022A69AAF|nr:hypothetical protein [Arthrobacter sp. ATA002]WAP50574.1 hypothetical protein OL239_11050 [Arthrobacter sp. ATA002]
MGKDKADVQLSGVPKHQVRSSGFQLRALLGPVDADHQSETSAACSRHACA